MYAFNYSIMHVKIPLKTSGPLREIKIKIIYSPASHIINPSSYMTEKQKNKNKHTPSGSYEEQRNDTYYKSKTNLQ